MESTQIDTHNNTQSLKDTDQIKQQIREKCNNLNEEHIQDIIETFNTFDVDEEGFIQELEILATMLMSLNCDVTKQMIMDIYKQLFNEKIFQETQVTILQFAQMVDYFVQEADPVEGVIATIQEQYDPHETGVCKYDQIIEFMEQYNYLDADQEACIKVLQEFKDKDSNINYSKAMRKLIQ